MITEKEGQIIVDELRPMSEFPLNIDCCLVLTRSYNTFEALGRKQSHGNLLDVWISGYMDGRKYEACELVGWIPMPLYQPKK